MSSYLALAKFLCRHPVTSRAPIAAAWRVLSWQLRSRLAHGDVIVPWIEGSKLVARRGMTGATGNIYAGLHEFADMAFVLHMLRPDDIFFDVGANIGSYTILASAVCGAITCAFEPDPDALSALRRNIAANGVGDRVIVVDAAVGDHIGSTAFTIGQDTVNRVASTIDFETRQVRMTTLDEVAGDTCPTLMKVDIEGLEEIAMRGASKLLADPRLKAIQLETVSNITQKTLAAAGFVQRHYDPIRRRLGNDPGEYPQSNALYVRDPAAIEAAVSIAPRRLVLGMSV